MNDLDEPVEAVLAFWLGFDETDPNVLKQRMKLWFSPTAAVDREIESRFRYLVEAAAEGALDAWARTPRGQLALIIVLDQFPRNLFRGTRAAFAQDLRALTQTFDGVEAGADRRLRPFERAFFYMPMQHSESADIQQRSVEVFTELSRVSAPAAVSRTLRGFAEYARLHQDIIARYGRFPHRNGVLGRVNSEQERAFLSDGGRTFGQ